MSRSADLARLGYDSYSDYLASAHWQDVRRRYRQSGRSLECICGEPSEALHHQTYERLGREELDDLIPLCRRCHTMIHVLHHRGITGLSVDALRDKARAARYAEERKLQKDKAVEEFLEGGLTPTGSFRGGLDPLADMLRKIEEDHAAGRIDASVHLAAIERRISAAEQKLWRRRLWRSNPNPS